MSHGVAPKINLFERMEFSKLDAPGTLKSARLDDVEKPETTDFNGVLTGLVEQLNQTVNAPEQLTQDAMLGKADVLGVNVFINRMSIDRISCLVFYVSTIRL